MDEAHFNRRPVPLLLLQLSSELCHLRDVMHNMSEILEEIRLDMAMSQRDELRTEVERYLAGFRESKK